MGLLTELFVSPREVAARFELGAMTNLEFETLWSMLAGRDRQHEPHRLELLPGESEDPENWTFRLPAPFVDLVLGIPPAELDAIAARWGRSEEIRADVKTMRGILEALIGLGRAAKASGLDLLLRVSL